MSTAPAEQSPMTPVPDQRRTRTNPPALHSHRYPPTAWELREIGIDLDDLARSESLFALSNGHIGARGTLDEGDPHGLPGTYLNSFYETRPLPYPEAGFGFPETGQTVVNVTDGKIIRLLVDDEPFDLRYGDILQHRRVLDLRSGLLRRLVEWRSPSGQIVRVRSARMVSLTQRSILAVDWEVEVVGGSARVLVQSELVANEHVAPGSNDPRVAAVLESPLIMVDHRGQGTRALLAHETRFSGLRMAAAMEHQVRAPDGHVREMSVWEDSARFMTGAKLEPGQRLGLTKYVSYGWSSQRSLHSLTDQVTAALISASHAGWQVLCDEQSDALTEFWDRADVQVEGDVAVQQAVRFSLFHTLQAGLRAEQRAIPAKGLTGPGYDGHAFWDTEMFVLPVLTATAPAAARDALRWRHSTLDLARERAQQLGLDGAAFPWRTIRGQECSGYWPAGTAAMHLNADIAAAFQRYLDWTADESFDRDYALEVLVETARLWMSLGYLGDDGKFHIDGVTGPDEYSAIVRDNIYTNLMAARNLDSAANSADRWPEQAQRMAVGAAEIERWRAAARSIAIPYNPHKQVHEQDHGYTSRVRLDFELAHRNGRYPLLLHVPYFDIYRKQVVKQADLMLAMHWCGDRFTPAEKARAFAYYEELTVRDSSLSASTQAVLAAEVGQVELATAYLTEAAMMDLHDLEQNTRDGLHLASLAGTWLAIVAGFGGMRDHGGQLSFHPQLAAHWTRLRFGIEWRGSRVDVDIQDGQVTYTALDAPVNGIFIRHAGERLHLRSGQPIVRPTIAVEPATSQPDQPAGRRPIGGRERDQR